MPIPRSLWTRTCGVAVLLWSAGAALPATSQDPPPHALFSSRTDLVVLHVSVVDRKSGFVSGLSREAFTVYEDGKPQAIQFFRNEDTPVTVGLAIDNSGSMQPKRDAVIASGLAFADSSHPQDEMFTMNFNERVWPGLRGHPFTSDHGELRAALAASTARGQTALFDAIAASLSQLAGGHQQKRVLIVISDGGDNASRTRFDDVLDRALRTNVVVYTVGLYDQYDDDANPKVLMQLAAATGGEAFFPRRTEEVTHILQRIATDIRSGYSIGYVPDVTRGHGFRPIRVTVRPPDGRKVSVRARRGYVLPSPDEDDERQ
jgi:VWFA-related protein